MTFLSKNMREIKFRAWLGGANGMEYKVMSGYLGIFYVPGLDPKDSASMSPMNTLYTKSTPTMQFIGLLDRNGKEMYEGDIIRLVNKRSSLHKCKHALCPHGRSDDSPHMAGLGVVGWNKKKAGFAWVKQEYYKDYPEKWQEFAFGIFDWENTASIEVIGNIYQNPELIH